MKKSIFSLILIFLLSVCTVFSQSEFPSWENPRQVKEEGYEIPYMEEDNPFVTHYAPWLRNLHLLSDYDLEHSIVGGEACQMVNVTKISPVDTDIMYFGTNTSGIYKTTTRGKHWYNVTGNAAGHDTWGILCDPIDKNTVYVTLRKTGSHRSTDGGKTWHQIVKDSDQTPGRVMSNSFAHDSEGNIYILAGSGVYKLDRKTDEVTNLFENDPGTRYITSLYANKGADWRDIYITENGVIYAAGVSRSTFRGGLYVSEDGGKNWEIRGEEGEYINNIRAITVHPEVPGRMFAAMKRNDSDGESEGFGLYRSEDYGNTWTRIFDYQAVKKPFLGLQFGPKEDNDGDKIPDSYPLYMCIDQTNYPLRVSYDEGVTFSQLYTSKDKLGYGSARRGEKSAAGWFYQGFDVDMSEPGRVVFACAGIFEYDKYDEEGNVRENKCRWINAGFSGVSVMDIAFDSNNKMFLNAIDSGSWITESGIYDGENYPTFDQNVDDYFIHSIFDPNDDNHIISYIGSANGYGTYSGIRQSYDGGVTFKPISEDAKLFTAEPPASDETTGIPGEEGEEQEETGDTTGNYDWASFGNAQVLCYDNNDENIIYTSYHNSYDNGKTWVKNPYFIAAVYRKNTKRQIALEKNGNNAIYLYLTEDGGETWKKQMLLEISNVKDMKFDENDPNFVWYTTSSALVKLDLKNKTGESQNSKFLYTAFSEFEINPKNPNHMLVASSPGTQASNMMYDFKVAESIDGGKTWNAVPGIWGGSINRMIFSKATDEVFIGGMCGTLIYDYNKFNYFSSLELSYGKNLNYITVPRINADGENVNNGKYFIAPDDVFYPHGKRLYGWELNGEVYSPGQWVEIGE